MSYIKSISLSVMVVILIIGCDDPKNGDPGKTTLIDVRVEPSGNICEYGGYRFATGLDENSNDILEKEEETNLEYICNPEPSQNTCNCQDGKNGHATLFISSHEDPGSNCEFGGIALRWGADTNDDGDLTPSEVTDTDYVCNGNPGVATLVVSAPVDPGTHCPEGGISITSGIDDNGDSVLDATEIDTIEYICNGSDGLNSIIRQEVEPAGTNCVNGGTVILSGLDLDRNGYLDNNEITDTSYICK